MLKILKPGQTVTLHEGISGESSTSIDGIITAINITSDGALSYRCGWWSDKNYYEQWFSPCQILEHHNASYLVLQADRPDLDMDSKVLKDAI